MPESNHNTQQEEITGPAIPISVELSPSATGIGTDTDQHEKDAVDDE